MVKVKYQALGLYSANPSDYKISQQLPLTVGSMQSLRQVRTWLEGCARLKETGSEDSGELSTSNDNQSLGEIYHDACTHHSTSAYIPTRLLDLGDTSSETWRICIPSEDEIDAVVYTTTSYRWGDKPFLKLTQQLLPDFRAENSLSQLPQTFQDVIVVTKRLGFQYIWIDALCIIQDSEEDFKNEVAKMADIYSNSAVNIIAASCESPFESLFRPRYSRGCHVGRFEPFWDASDPFFAILHSIDSITETKSIQREFDDAPTNVRGWILQERILPPRRLYFFCTQLYYVCRSSEFCEVFPEKVPSQIRSFCHIYDPPSPSQHDRTYNAFNKWMSLAQEYSMCSFTHPRDKIVALLGLVKVFQRATGDDYVAGLWKSRLSWTLGWSGIVDSPRRRSALNLAPTWSWLSIDGEIRYNERDFRGEHKTALCEILNVSVIPIDASSTDTDAPGLLTLRALSFSICAIADCHLNVPFLSDDLKENLSFIPDDTYEDVPAGTRLIMAILTVDAFCAKFQKRDLHAMEDPTRWYIEGLVLQYDEMKDLYHRVGVLSITAEESESYARKSPLLEAFGLTIKDTFGEVIVTDNKNWTVLRII